MARLFFFWPKWPLWPKWPTLANFPVGNTEVVATTSVLPTAFLYMTEGAIEHLTHIEGVDRVKLNRPRRKFVGYAGRG